MNSKVARLSGRRWIVIAGIVGISEPSVSRYVKRVRERLRGTLREVVREYSWTDEEVAEIERHRLDASHDLFDTALGDIDQGGQLSIDPIFNQYGISSPGNHSSQ